MAKVGKSWQKLAKVSKSCKRRSKLITVASSCQRLSQFGNKFKKLPKNSQRWSWLSCLELTKLHVVHWTTSPLEYSWAATIYATRYPTRYPDFFLLPYPNPTRSQKNPTRPSLLLTVNTQHCCWGFPTLSLYGCRFPSWKSGLRRTPTLAMQSLHPTRTPSIANHIGKWTMQYQII